jgi:tetratricopeptide (TPR) repeat protein
MLIKGENLAGLAKPAALGEAQLLYHHALAIDLEELALEDPAIQKHLKEYTALLLYREHLLGFNTTEESPHHRNLEQALCAARKASQKATFCLCALDAFEKQFKPDDPKLSAILAELAELFLKAQHFSAAEFLFCRSMISDANIHGATFDAVSEHARSFIILLLLKEYYYSGKEFNMQAVQKPLFGNESAVAEAGFYTPAMESLEEQVQPGHAKLPFLLSILGTMLLKFGRFGAAELFFRRRIPILEAQLGPDNLETAKARCEVAGLLLRRNEFPEAERLYRQGLASLEVENMEHPLIPAILSHLAFAILSMHRVEEAVPLLRRAVIILSASSQRDGKPHPNWRRAILQYSQFLMMYLPFDAVIEKLEEFGRDVVLMVANAMGQDDADNPSKSIQLILEEF